MPVSFSAYLATLANQPNLPPLNRVAFDYWHDYQTGQPIDGGVAFEPILRKLSLDGSLASLAMLNKFLDKAKPHLATSELTLPINQRNLLLFIGFYTGWVLSYHASQADFANQHELNPTLQWVSVEKLYQTFPPLAKLIEPDFSYSVAMSLLPIMDGEQPFLPTIISDSVFFPLVAVIERLYPRRQNSLLTTAPHFGYISDSLHDSVVVMLNRWQKLDVTPPSQTAHLEPTVSGNLANHSLINEPQPSFEPTPIAPANQLLTDLDNPLMERKDWQPATHEPSQPSPQPSTAQPVVTHFAFAIPDFSDLSMVDNEPIHEELAAQTTTTTTTETTLDKPIHNPINSELNVALAAELSQNLKSDLDDKSVQGTIGKPLLPTIPQTTSQQKADTTTAKKSGQKITSQGLSSRQAIAEAKKQAKQIALQKAEQAAQRAKEAEAKRQAEIAEVLANPRINEKLLNQRKSMVEESAIVKDSFSELEQDLAMPNLPDTLPDNVKHAYHQAIQILQHPQPTDDHAQTGKALALINKLVTANLPDAMLHQALWQLRGRTDLGLVQNHEQGIALLKAAANLQDSRAEKLLSKLYFSGEIVGLDSEQGKFWLARSAEHGHAEAKRLQQSFALVTTMNETRQDEDDYLKKLGIGVAALLLFLLIVIFAIKV